MSWWEKAYTLIHFPLVVLFYHELSARNGVLSQFVVTIGILVLLASLTSIGFLIEKRWFAPMLEFARCIIFFAAEQVIWPVVDTYEVFSLHRIFIIYWIRVMFLASAVGCGLLSLTRISVRVSDYVRRKGKKSAIGKVE